MLATLGAAAGRKLFSNKSQTSQITSYFCTIQKIPKLQITTLDGMDTRLMCYEFNNIRYVNDPINVDEKNNVFLKNPYYQSNAFYERYSPSMSWIMIIHFCIYNQCNQLNILSPGAKATTQKVLSLQIDKYRSHLEKNYIYIRWSNKDEEYPSTLVSEITMDFVEQNNIVVDVESHIKDYGKFLQTCYPQLMEKNENNKIMMNQYVIIFLLIKFLLK